MKYAMFLPSGSPEVMIDWARKIETVGFDSLWQGELVNSALIPHYYRNKLLDAFAA